MGPGFLERGFICIKVWGFALMIRFDFISFFSNTPWKWNNLVSPRPNYFIFIGFMKTGRGKGVRANPLNPLWIRHCTGTLQEWNTPLGLGSYILQRDTIRWCGFSSVSALFAIINAIFRRQNNAFLAVNYYGWKTVWILTDWLHILGYTTF